jgi:hypothetical protein
MDSNLLFIENLKPDRISEAFRATILTFRDQFRDRYAVKSKVHVPKFTFRCSGAFKRC